MKKKTRLLRGALALLLALLLMLSAVGCTARQKQEQTSPADKSDDASEKTDKSDKDDDSDDDRDDEPEDDGSIHVSSVEELVEAICPGAYIIVEPGWYNLTDYLSNYPNASDYDEWNEEHEYLEIGNAYDGLELFIGNVDGLRIEGGSEDPADVEIVTEPRHAAVLNFMDCTNIELVCLTMGHTDGAECSGDVLYFSNTQNVYLGSLDLYGCGVSGIACYDACGEMYVSDTKIHDCEYGPFDIFDGEGEFRFTNCTFVDNGWGGYYDSNKISQLSFVGCVFGQQESNAWYFRDDAYFEDCEFEEPTEYPDYGDTYIPVFDPEDMEQMTVTPENPMVDYTSWKAYAQVNPESGETMYFGDSGREDALDEYMYLEFDGAGEGSMEDGSGSTSFKWYCIGDDLVCIRDGERNIYATLYVNSDYDWWLLVEFEETLVWFY